MIIKNKYKLSEICFYIFLSLIMLYYAYRRSMVDYSIFNWTLYLAIPFLILKFLLEDVYKLSEIFMCFILVFLGVISAILSGSTSVLISFSIVIGMKNIDYIKALKIVFYIRLITVILNVISSILGIIPNRVVARAADGEIIRYALGYTHPNVFGMYCFTLISLCFILYGSKWKLKLIVSMIINIFQFILTNSRTSFLLINLYLLLVLFVKLWGRKKSIKRLKTIAIFSIPVGLIISLLLPLTLNLSIGPKLNSLLSSRISLSKDFLRVYGIKPFGQKILTLVGDLYWALDSGFLNLFIRFGAIVGIVCLFLFFITAKLNFKNQYIYIAIIMFALYGIIEDFLSSLLFNYLWIILGFAFYQFLNRKEIERKNKLYSLLFGENKI
ncbi:MAG: hypothetical protein NC320_07775 [Clostridium sp.]|nr:hypothetical protein [Clostridium sp.]